MQGELRSFGAVELNHSNALSQWEQRKANPPPGLPKQSTQSAFLDPEKVGAVSSR